MAEQEKCGNEHGYCEGCERPEFLKPHCRELHRVVAAMLAAAVLQGSPDAVAVVIELLATMATDHAYAATAHPLKAITLLRDMIADRLLELEQRRLAASGEVRVIPPMKPSVH